MQQSVIMPVPFARELDLGKTPDPRTPPLSLRRPPARQIVVSDDRLPLQRAFHWERERPDEVFLVQPMGRGELREWTWRQALDEARRMASYLVRLELPPGSAVGIISKNCAHFVLLDLAIWMAGHVSVALYPTLDVESIRYVLTHCDAKVLFVGKVDDWERQRAGVPAGIHQIGCTFSPASISKRWENIVRDTPPLAGSRVRPASDTALLLYTSGSTGRPKGVEHDFHALAAASAAWGHIFPLGPRERVLSYLPLAHAFERIVIEVPALVYGFRVYFAESLGRRS